MRDKILNMFISVIVFLAIFTGSLSAHGGELGNLVVIMADGEVNDNKNSLPDVFCNLRKPCKNIVGAFVEAISASKKRIIIIEKRENVSKCHSCQSFLSLYTYIQVNMGGMDDKWILESKFIDFVQAGTWGDVDPSIMHIFSFNRDRKILYINNSFMNQGIVQSGLTMFLLTPLSLKHIGDFASANVSVYGLKNIDLISYWEATPKFVLNGGKIEVHLYVNDKLFGRNTLSIFRVNKDKLDPIGKIDKRLFREN